MECEDAVLPEPLPKSHAIKCLTYEEIRTQPFIDKLCPFRVLALHLYGNQRLEEKTSKKFTSFMTRMDGLSHDQFKGVHMNDIPFVEVLLTVNVLLDDKNFVDGNFSGEVARRSDQKNDKTVRLLRFNNHICYRSNNIPVFQPFRCLIVTHSSARSQLEATFDHME